MNNLITPKVALIALGILGVIIGVFLFISLRKSSTVSTVQQPPISAPEPDEQTGNVMPTTSLKSPSLYTDEFLSVDYPDDWTYELGVLENNSGKNITFFPNKQSIENPIYEVSYDTSNYSLEKRVDYFERIGLTRSSVRINGINFVKLSGVSFDRVENGELIEKKNQAQYYIIGLNGNAVIIKFLYNGDEVNDRMEQILQQLLANTHFK